MKGFLLDSHGDAVIGEGDIKLAADADLLTQKIRQILGTNRGEWWLDSGEGIPVQEVLRKNPNQARIRDHIRRALKQVDKNLELLSCRFAVNGRKLQIEFTAKCGGQEITIETEV